LIFEPGLLPSKGGEKLICYHVCYQLGIQVFLPESNLKDIIVAYLKNEESSISSLHRKLTKDGCEVHRLILTGYLRALTDMGVLREREIPPSKVYGTSASRRLDIYELVGNRCRSFEMEPGEQADAAVFFLQRLFHRPVFLEELRRCGYDTVSDAGKVSGDDRAEARKVLAKAKLKIPYNDPCYSLDGDYEKEFLAFLTDLIVEEWDVRRLVAETKQTKLGLE